MWSLASLSQAPQPTGAQEPDADTDVGALIEELLPASFLQHSVGGFLEMLRENAAAVRKNLTSSLCLCGVALRVPGIEPITSCPSRPTSLWRAPLHIGVHK